MLEKLKQKIKNLIKKSSENYDFERLNIPTQRDFDVISLRGERAHQLLNDPILKEAFEALDLAIINKWASSPVMAKEEQHELRLMLQASKDFKRVLQGYIDQGKIEAKIFKAKESKIFNFKEKTQ